MQRKHYTLRLMNRAGRVIGTVHWISSSRVIDLERLRELGVTRVEVLP
ncbi:hypothetical protein [Pseudomonas nitroreducens]|nr:hypothetical protein [Pseudomonas nitroreducens]